MIGFITFGIKLIFSAIIAGALSYISKAHIEASDSDQMISFSMISLFATSLVGITFLLPTEIKSFSIASAIFIIIYVVNSFSLTTNILVKICFLFASTIGIIIGLGYVLHALLLCLILYMILNNSKSVIQMFTSNVGINKNDDAKLENNDKI